MKKKKMIKLVSWLGIVIMIIFYVVIAEYVDNKGTNQSVNKRNNNIFKEIIKHKPSEKELLKLRVKTEKKEEKFCKNCGRPLSSDRYEICQICVHEKQKRCEWPTREILKEKIRTKPFLQICKEYNVSDNAIRKWCKNYNLPYRAKDIKKYTDEEWENI